MNLLVATYGTLRKNQHNHYRLEKKGVKFLGEYTTPPNYTMRNYHGGFPAVSEKGNTSIKLEIYEVTDEVKKSLDQLESHYGKNNPDNFYDITTVKTPFGEAIMYVINKGIDNLPIIKSGDWLQK